MVGYDLILLKLNHSMHILSLPYSILLAVYRLIALIFHVLLGVLLTAYYSWIKQLSFKDEPYTHVIQWWLARITRILGLKIEATGEVATAPVLLVSNHVSWLDIPLLASLTNPRFLSKSEVKSWPLIGWLASRSGTLFITRGKLSAAEAAKNALVDALNDNSRVLIFPEGTTTTGVGVKRFQPRLYAAAIETDASVQAIAIRYLTSEGYLNERLPYVDNQSLLGNLFRIIGTPSTRVEVHFLHPIQCHDQSRRSLSETCEKQVSDILKSSSLKNR